MARYDVAVVGLGAFGSAALYQLAKRGARVLGIDRFSPPHALGSTHGESRITRMAVGEGLEYSPLALRSRLIWKAIEKENAQAAGARERRAAVQSVRLPDDLRPGRNGDAPRRGEVLREHRAGGEKIRDQAQGISLGRRHPRRLSAIRRRRHGSRLSRPVGRISAPRGLRCGRAVASRRGARPTFAAA